MAAWSTMFRGKNIVTAVERRAADPDLDPGSKFTAEETEAQTPS